MYKQILEIVQWIAASLSVTNDVETMKSKKMRKKICKDLVKMEEITNELKKNAIKVRDELEVLIHMIKDDKDFDMSKLCSLLEFQITLTQNIQDLIKGDYCYNSLMRCFDYDENRLLQLISGKCNLIHMMLNSISHSKEIPNTFDFSDYLYNEGQNDGTNSQSCYDPIAMFRKIYHGEIEMKFTSEDREELLRHLTFLYNQVIEFDSVNKLEEARKKLAEIIRNNFSIEEIVYERD